ncbi:hydroxymethylpyrimidine/phosphomethylpyrimidine kinase [Vagococcus sp.]|uniref:hydroxymethylpyrimidine/phosphomethylpyrimidine kinase n=1 Tax=Vagococcus sp. TaxID=1933889 RepID=UPI003F97335B
MKPVLIIAGSDTLSGGGLQADVRTFQRFEIPSCQILTCIVTVPSDTGEVDIYDMPLSLFEKELASLGDGSQFSGIKVGMLANLEIAKQVSLFLKKIVVDIPIVIDPVLALKESGFGMSTEIVHFFKQELLPLATVITPNLHEAELLSNHQGIETIAEMEQVAQELHQANIANIVIKGGLRFPGDEALDLLWSNQQLTLFKQRKLANYHNNGAGCTFASAITVGLIQGKTLIQSVAQAKSFVYQAIEQGIPFLPELGNVWQGFKEI